MTWAWWYLAILVIAAGCQLAGPGTVPDRHQVTRDQLVFYSDVKLPLHHRLLDDLTAVRGRICQKLDLPVSDEPIAVYLFGDEERYRSFMDENYPGFPNRRAIFLEDDTTLKVLAYWGAHVAEDLRHEVTHGYLHAVIPNLPLWLDEGLAEYFEVGRDRAGLNPTHLAALASADREGCWSPDLRRLEGLRNSDTMSQLDYAESWLWVHFLLESAPNAARLLQDQLLQLRLTGQPAHFADEMDKVFPDAANQLVEHLRHLARGPMSEASAPPASARAAQTR
jgi:hypothetical protein